MGRTRESGGHRGQLSRVRHKDVPSPAAAAKESMPAEQPCRSSQAVLPPLPAKRNFRKISCGAMLDQNVHLSR